MIAIMSFNINMYSPSATKASESVLVEVLRILRMYSEFFVLIGGWAPYYILEHFSKPLNFQHCGSVDIDLVMDQRLREATKYATIVELLLGRGYRQHVENGNIIPYRFDRTVESPIDRRMCDVHLDFITEPPETRLQDGLEAAGIRGCSVVFKHVFNHSIRGLLPGNGEISVEARIADVVGCLTTKGLAMRNRYKEKDAYDIYAVVNYYNEGPEDAASEFRSNIEDPTIKESLQTIHEQFSSPDAEGPYSVASFMYPTDTDLQERARTDAYMQLEKFFKSLS